MTREEKVRQAKLAQARLRQAQLSEGEQQPRGIRQRLYDNIIGDPNDGVTSTGEALGTWLNRAGESMTLGVVGDEASAAATGMLPGRSYEGELERYRANEEGMSTAGQVSADLTGALVPGAGIAGMIGRAASVPGRILTGALGGAAMGATQGFMEGEGGAEQRVSNALAGGGLGALIGGAIPAVGAGVRSIARSRAVNRAADQARQSTEQLRATGRAAYDAVDEAGVQIRPEAFDRFRNEALERLQTRTGYDELPGVGVTPRTARVMQTLDDASAQMAQDPTSALPFRSLDQARRRAGAAARDITNETEQAAGSELIGALDDFVQRLGPGDIAGGDVNTLQSAIGKARDAWGQLKRTQLIDGAIEQSENYVSGGASGVRNQLARILRNKKLSQGFTDAEREVLRSVIKGGVLEQVVHTAGGRIGQIAATTASAGIGAGMGPIGAALGAGIGGAISGGARMASNALASRGINQARDLISSNILRDPEVMNRLLTAGRAPEFLTNMGLNALTATGLR